MKIVTVAVNHAEKHVLGPELNTVCVSFLHTTPDKGGTPVLLYVSGNLFVDKKSCSPGNTPDKQES